MPTFRNSLPIQGKHQGFDLKRTPTNSAIQGIVTSDDFIVCDTHFFHGRTIPCERETNAEGKTIDDTCCHPCSLKTPYRCHAYVAAFDVKKTEHYLFECTSNAAKAFEEYKLANGTLRGCCFNAQRPKGTPNSKVCIQTSPVNLAKVRIPPTPDLIKALSIIWRIPAIAIGTQTTGNSPAVAKANGRQIASILSQPDNAPEPLSVGEILNERSLMNFTKKPAT
jgi:hypothetical protein